MKQPSYYDLPLLSQSELKTYLKCPTLWHAQYVTKTYTPPKTKNMILGNAVDEALTGDKTFSEEGGYLTPAEQKKLDAIVKRVNSQPVMKEFAWMSNQVELFTSEFKGKLDKFGIKKEPKKTPVAWIADIKTCADLDKFEYSVEDFGYLFQLNWYRRLVKFHFSHIRRFRFFFIVNESNKPYRFAVYEVSDRLVKSKNVDVNQALRLFKSKERFSKGICTVCPPELNCPYSFTTTKDIIKLQGF